MLGTTRPRHVSSVVGCVSLLGITLRQSQPQTQAPQLSHPGSQRPSVLQGSPRAASDCFALVHKPIPETITVVQGLIGVFGQREEV